LPSGDLSCGADVSEALGVTNYDAEPQSTRAHGDGKLSSVRAKDIYPVYGVSSLKKCPYLFREGEQVVITEKIHGTNFRFGYGGKRRFYYGTHRTNLQDCRSWFTRLRDFLLRRSVVNSNPGFGNPWSRAVEQYDLESKCKDAREYIFYGEIFGPGIQAGFDYSFTEPDIRIFDVYNPKTGEWLDYYERYGLVCSIGLLPVPSLYSGEFSLQRVKQLAEEASWFDGGLREGVVVESLAEQKKGKWVSEAYHLAKVSDAT
jgi:RNA ligase (TIGR02306 family)